MDLSKENKKNIWLLLAGRTVSKFGSAFYLIVLPLYILKTTGSLAQSGLFLSISSIPALLVTPVLGIFVEKVNRKWLLILCDFFTSLIFLILFVIPENFYGYRICLLVGTILIHVIANTFEIGSKLVFSELLQPEMIENYNGIKSIFDNVAAVTAPAVGTIVFGLWGFRIVLAIGALAYILSALQECFITYKKSEAACAAKVGNWLTQFVDGLVYIKNKKSILKMFTLVMALNFFIANADEIINPGIIVQKYHISEHLFGMISTAAAMGTIVAGWFIFRNKKVDLKGVLKKNFILNSSLMLGLGFLSVVMRNSPFVYFVIFLIFNFFIGIVTACINIPLSSYFQMRVPLDYQGRFFSLLTVASGLLIPLGISYTGFLSDLVGADIAYIINNICVIVVVLICRLEPECFQ